MKRRRRKRNSKRKRGLNNKIKKRTMEKICLSYQLMKLRSLRRRKEVRKRTEKKVNMKMRGTEKRTMMKRANTNGVRKVMNGTGITEKIRRHMRGAI